MKRFQFRLERLLQVRQAVESEQARRLGEAQWVQTECERVVDERAARVIEATLQLATESPTGRTVGMWSNLALILDAARAALVVAEKEYRDASDVVATERAQFDEARQARRTIERLREQRYETWQMDVTHEEQRTVDEVALRRFRARGVT